MKKALTLILAALMTTGVLASCGTNNTESDLEYVQDKGKMVVGITDYAPMDYIGENGEWTGFDAEFAQMVCEELGVECEFFVLADWGKRFMELESKTIDVIWNGMTISEEVLLNTNCSDPYVVNAQVLVMKADVIGNYTDTASLAGLKVAVENGSTGQDAAIAAGIPEANIVATQDMAAALMEVASGASDACVIDITMAQAMTGEGTSYANLAAGISLTFEEYGIGFRKGSDITAKVNELMKKWKADGTLQALADKYELTLAD